MCLIAVVLLKVGSGRQSFFQLAVLTLTVAKRKAGCQRGLACCQRCYRHQMVCVLRSGWVLLVFMKTASRGKSGRALEAPH